VRFLVPQPRRTKILEEILEFFKEGELKMDTLFISNVP